LVYGGYKAGLLELQPVFNTFNPAIRGKSAGRIREIVDDFAGNNADKVDGRMVRPIAEAHKTGKYTAILSNSYDYSIRKILEKSKYDGVFDEIVANKLLEKDQIAIRFSFDTIGRKQEILESEFLDKKRLRSQDLFYVGDSKETAIADMLPRGNYIIPLCCPGDFKQKMAKKGAFIPENEHDLAQYLLRK
jgi:phosphoserine phosphatase